MRARLLALATHPSCSGHLTIPGHPDRPARLEAAIAGADALGPSRVSVEVQEERVLDAISRVHAPELAARLRKACESGPPFFDSQDNPISRGTYDAACGAVAASLAAVDQVMAGNAEIVWVPVRPPGHHATHGKAMGFCFFNNVAVAAEELLARGCGPLLVVDFDVHHGNGTQAHFWERSDVFYLSLHLYPFYPGSGGADEIGIGAGRGHTRNVPLAAGADDEVYREALGAALDDALAMTTPQAVLVSAGFDAHRDDPLGGMALTAEGFGIMGRMINAAAAGGPIVAVLEGGYSVAALRGSVHAFLHGLV